MCPSILFTDAPPSKLSGARGPGRSARNQLPSWGALQRLVPGLKVDENTSFRLGPSIEFFTQI